MQQTQDGKATCPQAAVIEGEFTLTSGGALSQEKITKEHAFGPLHLTGANVSVFLYPSSGTGSGAAVAIWSCTTRYFQQRLVTFLFLSLLWSCLKQAQAWCSSSEPGTVLHLMSISTNCLPSREPPWDCQAHRPFGKCISLFSKQMGVSPRSPISTCL